MPDFNTIADVDNHYNALLASAEDADKPTLMVEQANAKVAVLTRQNQEASLRALKAEVLAAHPAVAELADLINGGTKEEMEAVATRLESKIAAGQTAPAPTEPANGVPSFGNSTPVGAPPTPPVPVANDELTQQRQAVTRAYKTGKSARTLDFDFSDYSRKRFREAVNQAKQNPSYRDS